MLCLHTGRWNQLRVIRFSLILFAGILCAGRPACAQLPDGTGRDVTVKICGKCHEFEKIIGYCLGADGWPQTIAEMIDRGAEGTEDHFNAIWCYLVANYGPSTPRPINVNKAAASELESSLEITPREAVAIAKYRTDNGNGSFNSIDDPKRVPDLNFEKDCSQEAAAGLLIIDTARSGMQKLGWIGCLGAAAGAFVWAADRPSASGNPQRDGWSRGERELSRESAFAGKIEFLYKYRFDNKARGLQALAQPIVGASSSATGASKNFGSWAAAPMRSTPWMLTLVSRTSNTIRLDGQTGRYSENAPMGIMAYRGQVVEAAGLGAKRLVITIGDCPAVGTFVKANE
jgi:hypothetical protein